MLLVFQKMKILLLLATIFFSETILANNYHLSHLSDPRLNSSLYDIIVNENLRAPRALIGNVRDILLKRGKINESTDIFKYKLIYYAPQLIPSPLLVTTTASTTTSEEEYLDVASNEEEKMKTTTTISTINDEAEILFEINQANGSIYLKTPHEPTLEYLCVKRRYCACFSCIFSLNLIYSTENKVNSDSLRVFIDDHNDMSPVFSFMSDTSLTVNVSEMSRVGDKFVIRNAAAHDSDAFYNRINYTLIDKTDYDKQIYSPSTKFLVQPVAKSSRDLYLVLRESVDFENQTDHRVILMASDNGRPEPLRSFADLNIRIVDENDNVPECGLSLFEAHVKENRVERDFMRLNSSDLDSAANRQLEYFLPNTESAQVLFHFEIDRETGSLSVKNALDYEKKDGYEFRVELVNSGLNGRSLKTYCNVKVNVIDQNDNPAKLELIKYLNESIAKEFYLFYLNDANRLRSRAVKFKDLSMIGGDHATYLDENSFQMDVYENNVKGITLALFRVVDVDTFGNYKFLIEHAYKKQMPIGSFEVRLLNETSREFALIATESFNAERVKLHRLKLTLFDMSEKNESTSSLMITQKKELLHNTEHFNASSFIMVKILDLNDNYPQFSKLYASSSMT